MRAAHLLLLLLLAPTGVAQAQEPAATDDPLAVWQSSPGSAERTSLEWEQLVVELATSGALVFEPYVDAEGRRVEDILRDKKIIVGPYYPVRVDAILCRANPDHCTLKEGGAHAVATWSNAAGDTINIPALSFESALTFASVEKPAGQSIDEIWGFSGFDCSDFGFSCAEAVEALNANNPAAHKVEAAGEVVVPQVFYRAEFDADNLTADGVELFKRGEVSAALKEHLVTTGDFYPNSGTPGSEPLFADQRELWELIGHPLGADEDTSGVDDIYRQPVTIGVIDTWLDAEHCELVGRIKVLGEVPPSAEPRPEECGWPASAANLAFDHATHVVGLIAAGINGQGLAGLEPFAEVTFRMVDPDVLARRRGREEFSVALYSDAVLEKIDVFNLSWGYRNDDDAFANDVLKSLLVETLRDKLFVVAAGNSGEDFELGACDALPACYFAAANIITVVGLDREAEHPRRWTKSNWSPSFHIGAIANDVLSISSNNGTAVLSGTSQAAPQVTAAAAYIISAHRKIHGQLAPLPAQRIKERLIYSSNLYHDLLSELQGGRLNIARAADIGVDRLVYGDDQRVHRGTLRQFGNDLSYQHLICEDVRTGDRRNIRRQDLYRMALVGEAYVVYSRPAFTPPETPMERLYPCKLATRSHTVLFEPAPGEPDAGEVIELRMVDIVDLTMRMSN